jgi:flagellar hook-basal body complex protein FliE
MAHCYAFVQIGTVSGMPVIIPWREHDIARERALVGSNTPVADQSGAATAGGFASALKASLDKISGDQTKAVGESQAFELGASNVSLNDVMVDMQKANVGFQFGLQVRNKLVSAYNDIMQMSV